MKARDEILDTLTKELCNRPDKGNFDVIRLYLGMAYQCSFENKEKYKTDVTSVVLYNAKTDEPIKIFPSIRNAAGLMQITQKSV